MEVNMGGLWPEPTEKSRENGWRLSYRFLECVKTRMDETDNENSASLETIENCLISASRVEIEWHEEGRGYKEK